MRRDAGHDVRNQYLMTGRGDGKAASLPAELSLALGAGPFGVVTSQGTYLAGKSVSLSTVPDILQSADARGLTRYDRGEDQARFRAEGHPLDQAEKQLVEGKATAVKLQEMLDQFKKDDPKIEDRHVIAAAFASGAARQAHFENSVMTSGLDTHSNHEKTHLKAQTAIWDEVAGVFKLFKKIPYRRGSLFDCTTFMVMSEFSRTPALNAAKGKDHNPFTNSVLLAGKGIVGGTVVGASRLLTRKQTESGAPDHLPGRMTSRRSSSLKVRRGRVSFFPKTWLRPSVGSLAARLRSRRLLRRFPSFRELRRVSERLET